MRGFDEGSAPSPRPGVGRRPETSLGGSWQPTPPDETQVTGVPSVTF